MNGLAALLALALVQSPDPRPVPPPDEPQEAPPPVEAPPRARPAPPAPEPVPAPEAGPAQQAVPAPEASPEPTVPAPTPRRRRSTPAPSQPAPDAGSPASQPAAAPATTSRPPPAGAAGVGPAASSPTERVQVAAAASRFFQALLARRSGDLAALCAPAFNFDGRVVSGADQVRSRWADVAASRDGAAYALLDLEILSAAEAQSRYGKPPKKVAALAAPGTWVAVANVSGRPTIVFFARQGGAWLATGMHD